VRAEVPGRNSAANGAGWCMSGGRRGPQLGEKCQSAAGIDRNCGYRPAA